MSSIPPESPSAPAVEPVSPAAPADKGYRYGVLALLILVYTFNFIDRQIIGILAGPIKEELNLTDTQLGWMGGLAFALFYTGLGIPIAWLADRFSRVWIMTVSLAVWSGFTALCGFTNSFWQLFLARMGVGVGEAGGVAPAYSLISDYFPPKERARAMAVYSFGIPIGSALGILFGGLLASLVDWRFAFIAVGFAGLLIAPVFRLLVKDPPRGQYDPKPEPGSPASRAAPMGVVLSTILPKPSFWLISFGASCSSILGYGLIFWLPSFFQRSFGLSLVDRSLFMAGIIFVGGIIGIWIGGMLGDKLGGKHKGAYALIPAVAFVLSIPCYAFGLLSESLVVAFFVFLVPQALGLVWLGPVITAIQHLGPANMRATASALFLFINNLIGIGFGTVFFGMLSDYLTPRYGDEALKMSILFGLVFYALSAVFFFLASRRLKRDWVG